MDNQELNHSANSNTGWDEKQSKLDPNTPKHQFISDGKPFEGSGKQQGLVDPPIVTMNKQNLHQNSNEDKSIRVTVDPKILVDHKYDHPFDDIEMGDGLFIPNPPNLNTDKHILQMHKQICAYRELNSEIEKDEDGDNIMESVIVEERKKNNDGTYQLDGKGNPIVGANAGARYKRIYYRNFVVRAVAAGDDIGQKIDSDGVVVIRVA